MNYLKNFERDAISDETIELLEPYVKAPWFTNSLAKNASVAGAGLHSWVVAIAEYHEKSKIVKPKKIFL